MTETRGSLLSTASPLVATFCFLRAISPTSNIAALSRTRSSTGAHGTSGKPSSSLGITNTIRIPSRVRAVRTGFPSTGPSSITNTSCRKPDSLSCVSAATHIVLRGWHMVFTARSETIPRGWRASTAAIIYRRITWRKPERHAIGSMITASTMRTTLSAMPKDMIKLSQ